MNVIVCVDDGMGMTFNNRRQSRDVRACLDMLELSGGDLIIAPYSEKLFRELGGYKLSLNPLDTAGGGEYVFIEDRGLSEHLHKIERLVIYHWNRAYPSDKKLDTPPTQHGFRLVDSYEFEGKSHPRITREIYER